MTDHASPDVLARQAPEMTPRELRARQVITAQETIAIWNAKLERYHTTASFCRCADYQYRGLGCHPTIEACAHMLSMRLLEAREAAS